MADNNAPPGWTDAQWQKVQDAVTDSFAKASVVSAFLPCYGPLPEGAANVRNPQVISSLPAEASLGVDDADTLRFIKLRVDVPLTREQIADESMSSALLAFKRAATLIAQAEDEIVFRGLDEFKASSKEKTLYEPSRVEPADSGLLPIAEKRIARAIAAAGKAGAAARAAAKPVPNTPDELIKVIIAVIGDLDKHGHPGPFACVLSNDLFALAHQPLNPSLVMPADRIKPFLSGGPLLRSGRIGPRHGLIVSLASDLIDIVVATPPKVAFLQVTAEAKFLFRVYEKFVPRVKLPIEYEQPFSRVQLEP